MPDIPICSRKLQEAALNGVGMPRKTRVQELESEISRLHEKLEEVDSRLLHIEKSAKLEPSKQNLKEEMEKLMAENEKLENGLVELVRELALLCPI